MWDETVGGPVRSAAERARKRAASGRPVLPVRYRKMRVARPAGHHFEDFDYAVFNHTRFASLENDIANCYANSLIQVRQCCFHCALSFCQDVR